jgi:hypothetical protein
VVTSGGGRNSWAFSRAAVMLYIMRGDYVTQVYSSVKSQKCSLKISTFSAKFLHPPNTYIEVYSHIIGLWFWIKN